MGSSFDRRYQVSADVNVELPFGPNRPWLNQGGFWGKALENWRLTTSTWQSGTPFTPRVQGAASDVARGTNGTLRADYNGRGSHRRLDDRSFLQHGGLLGAGRGSVRHRQPQHDHRPGSNC